MSEMTNEEAIAIIRKEYLCVDMDCDIERSCGKCNLMMPTKEPILEAYNMAIKALEQEQNIKSLGDELRMFQKSIKDDKVLIGFNMAVVICNKHFAGSEEV